MKLHSNHEYWKESSGLTQLSDIRINLESIKPEVYYKSQSFDDMMMFIF